MGLRRVSPVRALGSLATPQPRTPLHPGSVSLVGRCEDARDPPLFTEPTPPSQEEVRAPGTRPIFTQHPQPRSVSLGGGGEGARGDPPRVHRAPPPEGSEGVQGPAPSSQHHPPSQGEVRAAHGPSLSSQSPHPTSQGGGEGARDRPHLLSTAPRSAVSLGSGGEGGCAVGAQGRPGRRWERWMGSGHICLLSASVRRRAFSPAVGGGFRELALP